jgi:hypothetical protein
MRRGDAVLTRIGRCSAERGITLTGLAGGGATTLPQGFSHFAAGLKGSHSGA